MGEMCFVTFGSCVMMRFFFTGGNMVLQLTHRAHTHLLYYTTLKKNRSLNVGLKNASDIKLKLPKCSFLMKRRAS